MPFLSTLSLRRATQSDVIMQGGMMDFYPRSPCGERLRCAVRDATDNVFLSPLSLRRATGLGLVAAGLYRISIHALLAESDLIKYL